MSKKHLKTIIIAIVISASALFVFYQLVYLNHFSPKMQIKEYTQAINDRNWVRLCELTSLENEEEKVLLSFLNNDKNISESNGLLSVRRVNVISIERDNKSQFSEGNDIVYTVRSQMIVDKESEFFKNGVIVQKFVFERNSFDVHIKNIYHIGFDYAKK